MPLVSLSGKAFGWYTCIFRPRRGLQDLEEIKANRLLDLDRGPFRAFRPDIPHTDIAAAPEIVHILLLCGKQILESPRRHPIHCSFSAAAEFPRRRDLRGMIDHVFCQLYRTASAGLDREGDLTKVVGVNHLVSVGARGR